MRRALVAAAVLGATYLPFARTPVLTWGATAAEVAAGRRDYAGIGIKFGPGVSDALFVSPGQCRAARGCDSP
jgi:hypothetical protein